MTPLDLSTFLRGRDLFYCNCTACGRHMLAMYDPGDKKYYLYCERCRAYAPITEAPTIVVPRT